MKITIDRFFLGGCLVAACCAVGNTVWAEATEVAWSGEVKVPANAEVVCTDHSAVDSLTLAAGAVVRFQTDTAPTFAITGEVGSVIVKDTASTWTMSRSIPAFKGDYVLSKGITEIGTSCAFGVDNNKAYALVVSNGAELVYLESAILAKEVMRYRTVHIAGRGTDGLGVIKFPNVATTDGGILNNITLLSDATIYMTPGGLFFITGVLTFNGHKLTFKGGTPTLMTGSVDTNGEVYVEAPNDTQSTVLTLRSWDHANPSDGMRAGDRPFVLSGNCEINFCNGYLPVNRPLWISGLANVLSHNGNMGCSQHFATNHANWAGPVVFTNTRGFRN